MRLLLRLCAVLGLIAVLAGLLLDLSPLETAAPTHVDKLVHAALFAGVFLCLAILLPSLTAPALLVLTVMAGAGTEGLQAFVGRDSSWGDLLADAVGAGLALSGALLWRVRSRRAAALRRTRDPIQL